MADRFIIYGADYCQYCVNDPSFLESKNIEFVYLNMQEDVFGLDEAKEFYGWDTIPIIIKNNTETGKTTFVGGYSDLVQGLGYAGD